MSEIEWLFELDDMGGRGICEDIQAKDCTGNQKQSHCIGEARRMRGWFERREIEKTSA